MRADWFSMTPAGWFLLSLDSDFPSHLVSS
jgi:hypothetical protein